MARYDHIEFARIWNNRESYPTVRDVADELGVSVSYCKKFAYKQRKKSRRDPSITPLESRADNAISGVISEQLLDTSERKPGELVERLQELYKADPSRHLTRLFFRQETGIADSVWTQFWALISGCNWVVVTD